MQKKWSKGELRTLRVKKYSHKEVAAKLGRPYSSIVSKRTELKIESVSSVKPKINGTKVKTKAVVASRKREIMRISIPSTATNVQVNKRTIEITF